MGQCVQRKVLRGKNSRRWTLLKEVRAVEVEVLNIFRNEEVLQNHQEGINTIRTNHTCTDVHDGESREYFEVVKKEQE